MVFIYIYIYIYITIQFLSLFVSILLGLQTQQVNCRLSMLIIYFIHKHPLYETSKILIDHQIENPC